MGALTAKILSHKFPEIQIISVIYQNKTENCLFSLGLWALIFTLFGFFHVSDPRIEPFVDLLFFKDPGSCLENTYYKVKCQSIQYMSGNAGKMYLELNYISCFLSLFIC